MSQAVEAYRGVTATEKFRYLEILRERTQHDEAQALGNARRQGRAEGRTEGRAEGRAEGREEGRAEEREIWQGVVADKDAKLAELEALLRSRDT